MAWLVRCLYRPGGASDRLAVRAEHIRHMLAWLPQTVFGAAMLDADGQHFIGMVVALAVESSDEAQRFIDTEPYCRAGLFSSVEITPLAQMTPPNGPEFLQSELRKCH